MENETSPQTSPLNSRLDRFNGKQHIFTKDDSVKGGQTMSEKRRIANSSNSMVDGRYSKRIPHCNNCIFRSRCNAYKPEDPKAACKIIDIPNYMHLMSALTFTSEEEYDDFINKQMQMIHLKNLTANDQKRMENFVLLFLKIKETKYRTPKEQTINVQINNFSIEFQIFKDVTLKVLNKHPEVMQEWRAAIESAKQSN